MATGFVFIPNPFTPEEQLRWADRYDRFKLTFRWWNARLTTDRADVSDNMLNCRQARRTLQRIMRKEIWTNSSLKHSRQPQPCPQCSLVRPDPLSRARLVANQLLLLLEARERGKWTRFRMHCYGSSDGLR